MPKAIRISNTEVCVLIISHFALQIKFIKKKVELFEIWQIFSDKKFAHWSSGLAPCQTLVCVMCTHAHLMAAQALRQSSQLLLRVDWLAVTPSVALADYVCYPGRGGINCWKSLTCVYSRCRAQAGYANGAAANFKEKVVKHRTLITVNKSKEELEQ